MLIRNIIQTTTGIGYIVYSVGYILFLGLYAIFLPVNSTNSSYGLLIINKNWIWINCIQLVALLAIIISTFGLVYGNIIKNQVIGSIGLLITVIACLLMAGLSFTETFAWPTISKILDQSQMKEISENVLITRPFSIASVVGFYLFSIGYIILSAGLIIEKHINVLILLGIIVGCVLFSMSFLVSKELRYRITPIVILVMCSNFIFLGASILRMKNI